MLGLMSNTHVQERMVAFTHTGRGSREAHRVAVLLLIPPLAQVWTLSVQSSPVSVALCSHTWR